ncbi:MAG: LysR family transcriptional regulator, partial [Pseudomonadota bacterium]
EIMTVKLEILRHFCTVAETGNLAEAADRLGRTQSALSMSLKQLENHLGRKLFDGERKSQLSPLGTEVFRLAQQQLRQFDQTVQTIETVAVASHGIIRIASVPSVAALVFPAILEELNARYPGVQIELRDTDSRQVLDALATDKADIGIASGYHAMNGITASALFSDRFGLVGAPLHRLMQREKPPRIKEVVNRWFIRNSLCGLIDSPAFVEAVQQVRIAIQSNQSLINIIGSGKWLSVLPESVCSYLPASVAFRRIHDLDDQREVWLYRRERTRFTELTDACCEIVRAVQPPAV